MKGFFILMLSLSLFQAVDAQRKISDKDTLLYYINKNNGLTAIKDSADHFLVIMPADSSSGEKVYPIIEYYPNMKPKLMAYSSTQACNMLRFEGEYIDYYRNGHKRSIKQYANNTPVNNLTLYYPNGKLYADEAYDKNGNVLLINCRDSTGNALAQNGNGKWVRYDDDFTAVYGGAVKDSLEEGVWHALYNKSANDSTVFKRGLVISSTDKYWPGDKQGDMVFASVDQEPSCADFGKFLAKNMRYPADAKEHNIQGKVYVHMIVEKDGSLTSVKIIKSPGKSLSEEVLLMISMSPIWQPGMNQGKPVRCQFTVPISFTLSYDNR